MDFMNEAIVSTSAHGANVANNRGSPFQFLIGAAVALVILRMEVMRHAADLPARSGKRSNEGYFMSCMKFLWLYAPEITGLVAITGSTIYLRDQFKYGYFEADVVEVWTHLMEAWPILLTADTLLAWQAMLRLLVLLSNVFRTKTGPTPLSKETALLFFGAALGRAMLAKRSEAYLLDGFIGGNLTVACEVSSVLLLAILSRGVSKGACAATGLTLAVAARIAHRNRLAMTDGDHLTDSLFIFAQLAELLAAFAYLSRTVLWDSGCNGTGKGAVALNFTHFIMPLQQCMAAYYFVHAFEYAPSLVGTGLPFEILQIGSTIQVGAFAGAAVLYLVECLEAPTDDPDQHHAESAAAAPQHAPVAAVL